jgi:uncharacterized membrane protein
MALGPLEIFVLAFPSPAPGREVAEALAATQLRGDVRVIDVEIITKSAAGELDFADVAEINGIEDLAADLIALEMLGLFADDDIEEIAQFIEPGTCAVAVLVEHTWAREISNAVHASGGGLVAAARIPHDQVEDVELAIAAAADE